MTVAFVGAICAMRSRISWILGEFPVNEKARLAHQSGTVIVDFLGEPLVFKYLVEEGFSWRG